MAIQENGQPIRNEIPTVRLIDRITGQITIIPLTDVEPHTYAIDPAGNRIELDEPMRGTGNAIMQAAGQQRGSENRRLNNRSELLKKTLRDEFFNATDLAGEIPGVMKDLLQKTEDKMKGF